MKYFCSFRLKYDTIHDIYMIQIIYDLNMNLKEIEKKNYYLFFFCRNRKTTTEIRIQGLMW